MCFSTETKPGYNVVGEWVGGVVVVAGGGWWVVGGGWWCRVVSCWYAPSWSRSKRPRVCLQNARVPHHTRTFCRHKRLRFERIHGDIALRCCRFGRCSLSSNRPVVVGRCRLVVVVVLSSCRLLAVVVMTIWCGVVLSSCCPRGVVLSVNIVMCSAAAHNNTSPRVAGA